MEVKIEGGRIIGGKFPFQMTHSERRKQVLTTECNVAVGRFPSVNNTAIVFIT